MERQIDLRTCGEERTIENNFFSMATRASLRFADLVGQREIIARLEAYNEFYSSTGGRPGHILLIGEDGMGQSQLATSFANERDVPFTEVEAEELSIVGDVSALLTNLRKNQVLLISRIQALRKSHWQSFVNTMREGRLPIVIGSGPAQRTHIMDVSPFTLIATCHRKSDCPPSLLNDFSLVLTMQRYSTEDVENMVCRMAQRQEVEMEGAAARLLARYCDRRPRSVEATVLRMTRAVNKSVVSEQDVRRLLALSGIEAHSGGPIDQSQILMELSGQQFEQLITTLLGRMGFQTELTKVTGDGQSTLWRVLSAGVHDLSGAGLVG